MTISSRIAVMEAGRILQVYTPAGVYDYPNCQRVAEFIGSVNLFGGKVLGQQNGEVLVQSELEGALRVPCPQPLA
jgi:putrescine transport system ATP-binding protein